MRVNGEVRESGGIGKNFLFVLVVTGNVAWIAQIVILLLSLTASEASI